MAAFLRVSKKPQTVKTQAGDLGFSVFCGSFLKRKFHIFFDKRLASQGVLTSCANRRTNVPLYAYAFGLLGFGAPLTSDNLSKKQKPPVDSGKWTVNVSTAKLQIPIYRSLASPRGEARGCYEFVQKRL